MQNSDVEIIDDEEDLPDISVILESDEDPEPHRDSNSEHQLPNVERTVTPEPVRESTPTLQVTEDLDTAIKAAVLAAQW